MIQTRKRFQKGSLKRKGKQWVVQWWEDGHRRKARWPVSEITKSEAEIKLAEILAPINGKPPVSVAVSSNGNRSMPAAALTFGEFVERTYLPFYKGKWKRSTAMTNEDRINHHLVKEFGERTLSSFQRDELQSFLNRKATGLSHSIVAHLRWGLRQIFRMAVEERHLERNPAELLFIPRSARRPEHRVMTIEEVKRLFEVLDTRERLIAKLAILSGMRTGEIFALTWKSLDSESANITQRIYHGDIDSPKTHHSVRLAALPDGLGQAIEEWRKLSPHTAKNDWVFPSETLKRPVVPYNVWRRHIGAKLKAAGLAWVTFQVMRRTHSSLLRELDVAPEIRAQQMGHSVDVNENVYTRTSLDSRRSAVNKLEAAIAG